jgi:hypothetical protein
MKKYCCRIILGALIILCYSNYGTGQQKDNTNKRGIDGVREGQTVTKIKQAYGGEYSNLGQKFFDSVSIVGGNDSKQQYGQFENQQAFEVAIDLVKQGFSNGNYQALPVADGDTLTQRDYYKIIFQSNTMCHFYVVQLDSTGKIDPIFPSQLTTLNNPVEPNVRYEIPAGNNWLVLDANIGVETIYFIASRSRRTDIEKVLQELQRKNGSLIREQFMSMNESTVLNRGIAGMRPGNTKNVSFQDGSQGSYVPTLIKSIKAEFVMTRYFYHR